MLKKVRKTFEGDNAHFLYILAQGDMPGRHSSLLGWKFLSNKHLMDNYVFSKYSSVATRTVARRYSHFGKSVRRSVQKFHTKYMLQCFHDKWKSIQWYFQFGFKINCDFQIVNITFDGRITTFWHISWQCNLWVVLIKCWQWSKYHYVPLKIHFSLSTCYAVTYTLLNLDIIWWWYSVQDVTGVDGFPPLLGQSEFKRILTKSEMGV